MPDIDELTGLLTIQSFHEQLQKAVREAPNLVLAAMDLDHLLAFNEKYGHQAGDVWIRANAALFRQAFEAQGSLVGRYGGDEFVAAVPNVDLGEIYERAEQLRQQVETAGPQVTVAGQAIRPGNTISLGLAAYPANAGDPDDLIEKGKQALHRAKIAGGNRVYFYQETDTLTGLLNRHASHRTLEETLRKARETGEPLSVFLLDVDCFSAINDDYGHRAGDEVLARLARILERNYKEMGKVGRTGGDEFLVILPGQRADSAFILAEEVRRLVEDGEIQAAVGAHNYTLRYHISGGIAAYPGDAVERVDLLRKADEALYRSKRNGRNRISLPTSAQMVTKTSHYTQIQLERLAELARAQDKTEAFLLREALDDLLRRYGDPRV
jgi:diguanylate cyclase (GGDEF)-like protein